MTSPEIVDPEEINQRREKAKRDANDAIAAIEDRLHPAVVYPVKDALFNILLEYL